MGSSLIEKFKGLETKGKYLVIASLITALGFVLPWINVPLVGSLNALHGWLIIVFLLSLATAGLVLYKPKYAPIMAFVVGGLLLIKLLSLSLNHDRISACMSYASDWGSSMEHCSGFIGCFKWCLKYRGNVFDFEVFDLLKTGFYVTYIGAIGMVYYGIKCFRKK